MPANLFLGCLQVGRTAEIAKNTAAERRHGSLLPYIRNTESRACMITRSGTLGTGAMDDGEPLGGEVRPAHLRPLKPIQPVDLQAYPRSVSPADFRVLKLPNFNVRNVDRPDLVLFLVHACLPGICYLQLPGREPFRFRSVGRCSVIVVCYKRVATIVRQLL